MTDFNTLLPPFLEEKSAKFVLQIVNEAALVISFFLLLQLVQLVLLHFFLSGN